MNFRFFLLSMLSTSSITLINIYMYFIKYPKRNTVKIHSKRSIVINIADHDSTIIRRTQMGMTNTWGYGVVGRDKIQIWVAKKE